MLIKFGQIRPVRNLRDDSLVIMESPVNNRAFFVNSGQTYAQLTSFLNS